MRTIKQLTAAAALALTVALAGCGSSSGSPEPGSASSPATATPTVAGAGAPATGPHDDADVAFAQMMVPHHRQAVEMTDMILAKQGIDPQVTRLATEIKACQMPEIDRMTGWLTGWGRSSTPTEMDHAMGGTMSASEVDALERATGDEASLLFLTGMVVHHRGAIAMADDELARGQNPDAQELARSIKESQQGEIETMTSLVRKY